MRPTARILARAAQLYDLMEDSLTPGRTVGGGERVSGGTRVNAPSPADVSVIEHRHKLVRGLRWWVDAVRLDETTRIGGDVPAMCRFLLARLRDMDPDDVAELGDNVDEWNARAALLVGGPARTTVEVPGAAMDQAVRVADAARILGCAVRTVQRRVPAERRPGGMVVLGEAWRCELCDLRWGECPHTRVTVPVA